MQDDLSWLDERLLELLQSENLTHLEVILIYELDGNVNCFSRLLELDAHFEDTIDNSFTTLQSELY